MFPTISSKSTRAVVDAQARFSRLKDGRPSSHHFGLLSSERFIVSSRKGLLMRRNFYWILAVCLALSTQLFSQGKTSGTISGTVTDPSGALISNAQITITNTATGDTRTVTSGANGDYQVVDLAIGTYQVRVRQTGFREFVANAVELHVDS